LSSEVITRQFCQLKVLSVGEENAREAFELVSCLVNGVQIGAELVEDSLPIDDETNISVEIMFFH